MVCRSHSRAASPYSCSCVSGLSGSPSRAASPYSCSCVSGSPSTSARVSSTCCTPPPEYGEGEGENPKYRVCLLGSSNTGKTSLVTQFMTSEYMNTYDSSLGRSAGRGKLGLCDLEDSNKSHQDLQAESAKT